MEVSETAKKVMEEQNAVLSKLQDEKKPLPDLNQKLAEYKRQLKDMSKNELVRYCADVYIKATILGFENQDLKKELEASKTPKGPQSND